MSEFTITTIVAQAGAVLLAAIAAIVSWKTHKAVNSRMDEFKKLFMEAEQNKGVLKEKNEEQARKTVSERDDKLLGIAAAPPAVPVVQSLSPANIEMLMTELARILAQHKRETVVTKEGTVTITDATIVGKKE